MIKAENPLNTNLLDTDINITAPTKNINSENNSIPNDKENSLLNLKDQPFWQSTINWWHKIALFLLIAQGLQGTWQSVKFIAIDYKEFEKN